MLSPIIRLIIFSIKEEPECDDLDACVEVIANQQIQDVDESADLSDEEESKLGEIFHEQIEEQNLSMYFGETVI